MSARGRIRARARPHGSAGWRTPDRVSCCSPAMSTALATAELYPAWSRFVRRALTRLGVPRADVDDLAQDVFVTLHRKRCTFANDRVARAWLYGTARRVASNDRRGRDRAALREPAWSPIEPPAPDRVLEQAEAAAIVQRFAAALPRPARAVFELSEVAGLSAPEIANELGLPLNTTYSHIRRVRRRFARTVAVMIALLLVLVALLGAGCATEVRSDGERVAVRGDSHVDDRAALRR
jgi:RNA polymerase sigma factor (sigma-70 family)